MSITYTALAEALVDIAQSLAGQAAAADLAGDRAVANALRREADKLHAAADVLRLMAAVAREEAP